MTYDPTTPEWFYPILIHLDSRFDQIKEGQEGLQAQINSLGDEVGDMRKEMDYKFEIVFDELHSIRLELKNKVDREEFEAFKSQVLS